MLRKAAQFFVNNVLQPKRNNNSPLKLLRYQSNSANLIYDQYLQKFNDEKIPEPENSLEIIFAHVLEKTTLKAVRGDEILKEIKLTNDQITKIDEFAHCRLARMPVQYIISQWEFRDLCLKMKIPVFIPRPETEELCELIMQQINKDDAKLKILEIGCGSGAISLSLLSTLPVVENIIAIDQSKTACELTIDNATNLKLNDRLRVFKHRIVDDNLPKEIEALSPKFNLIVSNPPYVPTKDLLKMQPEIYLFEDIRALDGGPDGLKFIEILLKLASKYLEKSGVLWMEVDSRHPELIQKMIENNHDKWGLKFISSYKDIFQKERFVEILKE